MANLLLAFLRRTTLLKFGIQIIMKFSETKCSWSEKPSKSAPIARRDCGSIFKILPTFCGKLFVAFLVLFFLVKKIQAGVLMKILTTAQWEFLILAVLLVIPNIWIQALKWHYLLKLVHPAISLSNAFKSLLVGFPLGFVTPGRIGEIGRAFFIKEIHRRTTLNLAIFDKFSNLFITVVIGLGGLFLLSKNQFLLNFKLTIEIIFLILIGFLLCPILFLPLIKKIFARFSFGGVEYLIIFGFSILFYSIFLLQFLCLILSFQRVNLLFASGAAASVFLVKTLLPISIGDLGVREGSSVFFFNQIGLAPAPAFNAAFILFLINVGIPALFGLCFILNERLTKVND